MRKFLPFILIYSCAFFTRNEAVKTLPKQPNEVFSLAMDYYKNRDYTKALEVFKKLLYSYPINKFSDDAQFYIAKIYYIKGEYDLAMMEIDFFIRNFTYSELYIDALLLAGEIYYKKYSNIHLDISELNVGKSYVEKVLRMTDDTTKLNKARSILKKIRKRFADKLLLAAETYRKLKKYKAEYIYLKEYMKMYSDMEDTVYVKKRLKELEGLLNEGGSDRW